MEQRVGQVVRALLAVCGGGRFAALDISVSKSVQGRGLGRRLNGVNLVVK
jgi:ribosomal protein S18 acetylase RimI-like enzyme